MTIRAYEVAIQTADLRLSRVEVTTTKAEAVQIARQWARETSGEIAWVHVFSVATDQSVFSIQNLA
jgi:hypothetical protein